MFFLLKKSQFRASQIEKQASPLLKLLIPPTNVSDADSSLSNFLSSSGFRWLRWHMEVRPYSPPIMEYSSEIQMRGHTIRRENTPDCSYAAFV